MPWMTFGADCTLSTAKDKEVCRATGLPNFNSLGWPDPAKTKTKTKTKNPGASGIRSRDLPLSRGGHLNHLATEAVLWRDWPVSDQLSLLSRHGVPLPLFPRIRPPRWPSGRASASRAEDPGFESRLRRDFSGVESYQWLKHWHSSGYPARRLALQGQRWDW